jgi:hypothetical protein
MVDPQQGFVSRSDARERRETNAVVVHGSLAYQYIEMQPVEMV